MSNRNTIFVDTTPNDTTPNDTMPNDTTPNDNDYKNALKLKDVNFLLEKKLFYKTQLTYLFDMEQQIRSFEKMIRDEISQIQNELLDKCQHDWMIGSEGGIDESPEYICAICDNCYR